MVRIATEEDLDALAELEMQLFPENSLNENSLRQELSESIGFVIGRPVKAYAIVRFSSELVDILRVGVREDSRRRGYGQLLVEHVLEHHRPTMLTVVRSNTPAVTLYTKLGFKVVGALMPDFYAWTMLWTPTDGST